MPRGIPNSGVRKQRTSRKTSTGGGGGSGFGPQFWNSFQKLYTQMEQLHQKHGGQQTRGRRGRTASTGQKRRATGTRQRRAAAA